MKNFFLCFLILFSVSTFADELDQIDQFKGNYLLANGSYFCPAQLVINIEEDMISIGNGKEYVSNSYSVLFFGLR